MKLMFLSVVFFPNITVCSAGDQVVGGGGGGDGGQSWHT